MKIIYLTILICLFYYSNSLTQTQYGESGLFYTPNAYAILPGVYEFGILSNVQIDENNLEYPSALFFAMGIAPRIEGFVSYPDIFLIGKQNNTRQEYGNLGLKVRFASWLNKRRQIALTTYCKYFVNNMITNAPDYLPGGMLHMSWITEKRKVFHFGINGFKVSGKRKNIKLNLAMELSFFDELVNIYFDSNLSAFNMLSQENDWFGFVQMTQWHPHNNIYIECGIGMEKINKKNLFFYHLGFSFSSGQRIISIVRKKKEELPKPPPLEEVMENVQAKESK